MSQSSYVLGSSPRELARLTLQDQVLRPVTKRLLSQAQLKEGSRILDLGCGAGDVSMMAAKMVGPQGSVVGVDQSSEAIAKAESRAREAGLPQIEFLTTRVEELASIDQFDGIIGRYVLIHQSSPVAFIGAATRHLRPGGWIAFHEPLFHFELEGQPMAPLFKQQIDLFLKASSAFPNRYAGGRMVEHFQTAGLPCPELFSEVPMGGADSVIYGWFVETMRSLLPLPVKQGFVTEREMSIDTLEERLRSEAAMLKSQASAAIQVCAWAKL